MRSHFTTASPPTKIQTPTEPASVRVRVTDVAVVIVADTALIISTFADVAAVVVAAVVAKVVNNFR